MYPNNAYPEFYPPEICELIYDLYSGHPHESILRTLDSLKGPGSGGYSKQSLMQALRFLKANAPGGQSDFDICYFDVATRERDFF